VAERAVRHLRRLGRQVDSVTLARELLSTTVGDEAAARKILEAAFSNDPRLAYEGGAWRLTSPPPQGEERPDGTEYPEADRALILVRGGPQGRGKPFKLTSISALRLRADDVISACGGDAVEGPQGSRLRRSILETLDGAIPIIHDPPGAIKALEAWLDEPLAMPISLRRLAHDRLGMSVAHDLESLVARLDLPWRETDDPLEQADALDSCLQLLRRQGERLNDIRIEQHRGAAPIDWTRYAFNREFLRRVPSAAGTYRFFDEHGKLLYVGKSKNLNKRLNAYFRESSRRRPERVQKLLDSLHRMEYQATISDLEAMLREAAAIRRERPERNVLRNVRASKSRAGRLRSILILEPSEPPLVLRAYLISNGRLVDRIGIGPRGGGLRRIRRVLDDHFFSVPLGPTTQSGPDLDVEIVARWLAANRDRVVAFDPTELRTSEEVIERLRWFLGQGGPFDGDGSPIFSR
jgi:hypothetical protein